MSTSRLSGNFELRHLFRFFTLLTMLSLIVWGMIVLGNPKTWRWVRNAGAQKTSVDVGEPPPQRLGADFHYRVGEIGLLIGTTSQPFPTPLGQHAGIVLTNLYEHVAPNEIITSNRRTLPPNMEVLSRASDNEMHLADTIGLDRVRENDRLAREHLIRLALSNNEADIEADARSDIKYAFMKGAPRRYRGELVKLEGQLLWLRPFPLLHAKKDPHLPDEIYEGLLEHEHNRNQPVMIMFAELPEGLPSRGTWSDLYLENVRMSGFYLKLLKVEVPVRPTKDGKPAKDGVRVDQLPVFVGRTIHLPLPEPKLDFWDMLRALGYTFLGVFLVGGFAYYIYGRMERRYNAKLSSVRERIRNQPPTFVPPTPEPEVPMAFVVPQPPPNREQQSEG